MIEHLLDHHQTQHCRQHQHDSHHDQQLHTATGVLEDGDNQTEAGDDQLPSRRAYQGDDHINQDGTISMVVHHRDHIDCDDEKTRRLWQG